MFAHTVSQGETLTSIGNEYGLSPQYIQNTNLLPNPNNLVVGQNILIIYPRVTHTVKEGDSLLSIAQMHSISVEDILRNNPVLSIIPEIYPGDEIVIEYDESPLKEAVSNGYTYGGLSGTELRLTLPYLTFVSPFTYGVNSDGSLIRANAENTILSTSFYSAKPLLHLSTLTVSGEFNTANATVILNNTDLQYTLAQNLLNEIRYYGYSGLDIDFEFINPSDSENYANLIELLKNFLNPYGYIVIAALAPKTSADQRGVLYEGHNYAKIGAAANLSFVMTYEWGYTYGPPMAVSPIESVKRVLNYAVTEIPSQKILMGMPTYGYNWTLPYVRGGPPAQSISNIEAIQTALQYGAEIKYDEYSQSPYFYYTDENNLMHEVWFEDAKSSLAKHRLIYDYMLSGCGYWNLERPFPQNWMILNNMYTIYNYSSYNVSRLLYGI